MGLDITAYSKLKRATPETEEDREECVDIYAVTEEWRSRLEGIEEGAYEEEGASFGFRAGSYGGYNRWREQLARLVGTTPEEVWRGTKPPAFGELIEFSDAEGAIGPVVSAKLAGDFADWHERAIAFASGLEGQDREWFLQKYVDWLRAFKLASDGGAVRFH